MLAKLFVKRKRLEKYVYKFEKSVEFLIAAYGRLGERDKSSFSVEQRM